MIDLRHGDMRDVLPTIEAESIESVVTDPPYGLEFMGKEWDAPWKGDGWQTGAGFSKPGIGERKTAWPSFTGGNDEFGGANPTCATCGGRARGKKKCDCATPDWRVKGAAPDRMYGRQRQMQTYQRWCKSWAGEVLRVLKPGGYMLVFGGTRTFHRLACAIEDAGFEVRDTIGWLYGQGFPKSLNLGNGWGTALKPAMELICVARKPLSERTVAGNVLRHGTGGINVDACRIGTGDDVPVFATSGGQKFEVGCRDQQVRRVGSNTIGRWPANLCHDGSPEVEAAFAAFGEAGGNSGGAFSRTGQLYGQLNTPVGYTDTGTASRFFYTAKADKGDRANSRHPTIKPVDLIRWLVRMVTPPNGTVLDPFAGSGTTGEAAMLEGFDAILIEREVEHHADIQHRQRRWHGGDLPLFAEAAE